jgi:Tol biopolymer transport system component/serine/threonine protein kinase
MMSITPGNMEREVWQQVDELYHAALERPIGQRAAFLNEACPDSDIRREVESLLNFEPADGSLFDSPAWEKRLAPGERLGPYEIVGRVGAGGMGEVWKARDTRLGRDVAIKVCAERFSGRFRREARAIAALNHPHICTLYDVGVDCLVMEYIEGKPLQGPLPLDQVLTLGAQIADALSAAHRKGIVHRDLKPANILLTGPKGRPSVKLLDFGLAKMDLANIDKTGQRASDSTPTATQTREGAILGTLQYMAPEQLQGRETDARSDIFSLGCVLYELLAGRRAFEGSDSASISAAILKEAPPPLTAPLASGPFARLVRKCLAKDPDERWQSASDLRDELLWIASGDAQAGPIPSAPARRRTRLWAAAGALIMFALTAAWLFLRPASGTPETLVPVTSYPGSERFPSFSPDGRQIAFTWAGEKGDNYDIYVKLVGETNALRLTTDPAADTYPVWAPDGKRIAFRRAGPHSGIYTVSALGGAEQKLSDFATSYQMSWSPDGKWLAVSSNDPASSIFLLPAEGGEPRRVTNPKSPGFDRAPSFSPDGRQLAYTDCGGAYNCDVYIQDLNEAYVPRSGARRITNQNFWLFGLTWSRDGKSVIYSGSAFAGLLPYLWRAGIDGRPPQRLEIAGPLARYPSVSPVGNRLVFQRNLLDYDIWRYRVGGAAEPLIVSSLADSSPQFSPDGNRIAFESDRSGEAEQIWVAEADGSKPVQMTHSLGRHQGSPRWSPDGRWIAFDSQGEDGHWDIYVMDESGGRPRRITPEPSDEYVPSWSRDGKWIYFSSNRTGRQEIWRVPFAGGTPEQLTKEGGFVAYESADGTTLFYTKSTGSVADEQALTSSPLFARPLSGGAERQLLDWITLRAFVPVDDGIYYIGRRSDKGQYSLQFFQFSTQTSRVLTSIDGVPNLGLSVSPDRTAILFTKSVKSGDDLMMIENFH